MWTHLYRMMEGKSVCKFHERMENFVEGFSDRCPSFIKYFAATYKERAQMWAMCYRQFYHAETDTNMFVETFHNRLKTFYMDRCLTKDSMIWLVCCFKLKKTTTGIISQGLRTKVN